MDIQFLSASAKETAPARGASWGHLHQMLMCGINIWSYVPSHPGDIRSVPLAGSPWLTGSPVVAPDDNPIAEDL